MKTLKKALKILPNASKLYTMPIYRLNLHEYQSAELLHKHGLPVLIVKKLKINNSTIINKFYC